MPYNCCVPGCRGNYKNGPKVKVFSFPNNTEISKKWILAIKRKDFAPTINSKVCQKHFTPQDIIKETSGYDSKKKVTITVPLKNYRLKPDAVPSIFEDLPYKHSKKVKISALKDNQEQDNIESSVGSSMQLPPKVTNEKKVMKLSKKILVMNQTGKAISPKKSPSTSHQFVRAVSPKKSPSMSDQFRAVPPKKAPSTSDESVIDVSSNKPSLTTDRPIIAVIKAEDCKADVEETPEKTEEDIDCEMESPDSNSFTLPSPYKNLPSVSVCLKEEDRVSFTRELKGVKRSPSTGSNSSTGSTDAQKLGASVTKRKKIEKPAPVVIGRHNDCYCWVCHRENVVLCCIACPRAYHNKCAGEPHGVPQDWVCPECQRVLAAENVDTRSSTLSEISLDKLGALLKLSLNKMKQRAPIAFHQPVSLEHYPLYLHYVIHPMDFSLLERNIKQKIYGCTEAFLADVKWIAHNSCVFNGTQHPLSTNAKNLVKSCDQDMQEIEVCPDCFVHSVVRNKYWFSEVCRKPHPLVWAKLKGFPYWPAKVVRIVDGNVDARFFGAHDRAWVPVSQCYHLSKEMPTTSKPKKKGNYEVALDELNVHVHLIIQKFGCFEYAAYRTCFNTQDNYLMYHGIDIDKAGKEDISIDNSTSQSEIKFYNSEKENRFANFMESESEKSNAGESNFSKIESETQQNSSLKIDASPTPFFFKERKSTDSVLSEKEVSNDESNEPRTSIEVDETPEQKIETVKASPVKEPEKVSDSDQLRKLELALERIKGYVSLNDDTEKEISEVQNNEKEEKEVENEKSVSEEERKDSSEKIKLSPLFKRVTTLPVIESSSSKENLEDISAPIQLSNHTDAFFLKLNETIESCKAKLGISEINDDISSDESAGDENSSKSDDDEDDSSASEGEKEVSDEDEEVSDEDEEGEIMEVSDEEVQNEDEENKLEDKDSEDEDSESDEESNSHSTDTDTESTSKVSAKKADRSASKDDVDDENDARELNRNENGDLVKEFSVDSSEAIITNPNMQVPEVTIEDSGSMHIGEENSSSENSNEPKEISESVATKESSLVKSPQTVISPKQDSTSPNFSSSIIDKGNSSNANTVKIHDNTTPAINFSSVNDKRGMHDGNMHNDKHEFSSNGHSLFPVKSHSSGSIDERLDNIMKDSLVEHGENSPALYKKEDEDDEIFICTPTRPKSPPVIVLDDDQENEDSSVSDTFAIKSPPFSTSAESISNEENPSMRTNFRDERANSARRTVSNIHKNSNEKSSPENKMQLNRNVNNENRILDSEGLIERRKRKLSSDSSSEDEIQIVTPVKKVALTGAIRTFNKPSSLKPNTPTLETCKRNLEKASLNQIVKSPSPSGSSGVVVESNNSVQKESPVPQNIDTLLRSPVIDASNLTDKDKEILFLRGKLNCIMTAYKIQTWKCNQEREELRHNMNLIVMEMRASLEADKKQAIETLVQNHEQEKQKLIEEAKRKQWCASCLKESRYACCWNTSYCSIDCQKRHFPEHRNSCTQVRNKNIEIQTVATKSSENNENKKVIILNMKSSDNSQQIPATKPQIQVLPAKQASQTASTSNSNSNIQFVLAQPPLKLPPELPMISPTSTATTSNEQDLDSAQIIHQVRNKSCDLETAITLLKKKNMETSVSLKKKKAESKEKSKESKEKAKEEINLEDIYFPSPPAVTFEGYESASPDPNLIIAENEETSADYVPEPSDSELLDSVSPEPDIVLSDADDVDNEMVNIGYGLDVKAKFLNKCLVYGKDAKKLTRCLMDVLFADLKLLASCSAFGQKSNVTKLTRAALPTRKVHAIIDFVRKRFPEAAKSEIVFAMNMKCKEARVLLSKKGGGIPRKRTGRRSLAREKEDELKSTAATTTVAPLSVATTSQVIVTPCSKVSPNVVCVKSSDKSQVLPFIAPNKPNILRCNRRILLKPKPLPNSITNAAVTQNPPPKRSETVKTLLANKGRLTVGGGTTDGTKLLMALDTIKQCTTSAHPVTVSNTHQVTAPGAHPVTVSSTQLVATSGSQPAVSSTSTASVRPYIIIGPHINAVRPTSSVLQHPAFPVSSNLKK